MTLQPDDPTPAGAVPPAPGPLPDLIAVMAAEAAALQSRHGEPAEAELTVDAAGAYDFGVWLGYPASPTRGYGCAGTLAEAAARAEHDRRDRLTAELRDLRVKAARLGCSRHLTAEGER